MDSLIASKKNSHETVQEYVYRVLSYNLLNMRLTPGMSLSEAEVASLLSVSRTPTREAFIRLGRLGLLNILPQRGTFVAKIDVAQINEFRFLRLTLEKAILELACASFPEDSFHQLEENLEKQKDVLEAQEFEAFFHLDNEMHACIFRGCEKPHIWTMMQEANVNYVRARVLDLTGITAEMDRLYTQHCQIAEAIRTRDNALGQSIIEKHINKVTADVAALQEKYPNYFL